MWKKRMHRMSAGALLARILFQVTTQTQTAAASADKLMGYNIRNRGDIGLVVFGSLRNNGGNAITNSRMADADSRESDSRCPLSIAERRSLMNMPKSSIQPLTLANATA
jgi:hypothetical protein